MNPQGVLPMSLATVVSLVLALASSGCGCSDDIERSEDFHGEIGGQQLEDVRTEYADLEERCRAACGEVIIIDGDGGVSMWEIVTCEAVGAEIDPDGPGDSWDPEDPWDPAYDTVEVSCHAEWTQSSFCTGRRPLGHLEPSLVVDSRGSWFAAHAHLEAAAVTAFCQLAAWLEARDAPRELIARCEAAAADERRHARMMGRQAAACGAEVPVAELESNPSCDLFEVARHNAVEGCVSEAFAALMAAHQADHADTAEMRDLFSTLAADELRHGQLAWDLHAWLLPLLSPEQREGVIAAQARALVELPKLVAQMADHTPGDLGWPTPGRASELARRFAALVSGDATTPAREQAPVSAPC